MQLEPGQGQYRYLHNGGETGVIESWSVRPAGAPAALDVHCERSAPGLQCRLEASVTDGLLRCCRLIWERRGDDPVTLDYQGGADTQVLQRNGSDAEPQSQVWEAGTASPLFYPLMRLFTGPVMRSLCAQGGRGSVLVPRIAAHTTSEALLLPEVSKRRAWCEREADTESPWELWRFVGGPYTVDASFWLDDRGLLQRYSWRQAPDSLWEVSLIEGESI